MEDYKKKYEETFKRAKVYYDIDTDNTMMVHAKGIMEHIFPELKESEDEMIRKALISFLKSPFMNENITDERVAPWLAWLEKQGEKPAENTNNVYPETLDKAIDLYYYSYGNGNGYFENLSFEKFKDIVKTFVSDYGKQNYAWSEEDESLRRRCIGAIDMANLTDYTKDNLLNWLKSLKDKVQPQSQQEWSEEDVNRFRNLIYLVEQSNEGKGTKEGFVKFINRLKSLKPQNTWKPSDEQMKQLGWIAEQNKDNMIGKELMTLYNDLKKLKG